MCAIMYPETYSIWRFIHEPFPMEFHHHCLFFIHCARGRGDTHSEYIKNKINQNYHSVQIWSYQYLYGFLHGSVEQSSSSVKLRDSLIGQHVTGPHQHDVVVIHRAQATVALVGFRVWFAGAVSRAGRFDSRSNMSDTSTLIRWSVTSRLWTFSVESESSVFLAMLPSRSSEVKWNAISTNYLYLIPLIPRFTIPFQIQNFPSCRESVAHSRVTDPLASDSACDSASDSASKQPRHLVWPVGHEGFERSVM